MGKRLPQVELLAEVDHEWSKLQALVASVSKRQMSLPTVNESGWALKDVLSHVWDWQVRTIGWYQAGLRGEVPRLPDADFGWGQVRQLNDQIFRQHRRLSATRAINQLAESHARLRDLIEQLSDDTLTQIGVYEWTGTSWTLSDYLRAGSASHYRWASKKFRRWKRENISN